MTTVQMLAVLLSFGVLGVGANAVLVVAAIWQHEGKGRGIVK